MRQRLFIHLAWTTRERRPLIDARVASFLDRYLPAVASRERAQVLALGVVQTHVHVLLRIHPLTSISRLIKRMKGGSSAVATREGHDDPLAPLRWARGYSVSSVSERALAIVAEYVNGQLEHHPRDRIAGWTPTRRNPFPLPGAPAPGPRHEFIRADQGKAATLERMA